MIMNVKSKPSLVDRKVLRTPRFLRLARSLTKLREGVSCSRITRFFLGRGCPGKLACQQADTFGAFPFKSICAAIGR
jgi:hypothetical protein